MVSFYRLWSVELLPYISKSLIWNQGRLKLPFKSKHLKWHREDGGGSWATAGSITSRHPLSAFTGLPAPAGSTDPAAPAASFNARAHRQTAFPPLLWLWCYCSSRCSAASARTATSASYSAASKIIPGVHIAVLPQTWASWTSQHHRDIAADDKTWHTRCTITLTLMSWGGWKNKDTPLLHTPPLHL